MCLACHVYFLQPCGHLWERADLLAPLYVMLSCCCFYHLSIPYRVLGHVWYLIVSIPDLCILLYFAHGQYAVPGISKYYKDTQRCGKTRKDTQRRAKTRKGTQRHAQTGELQRRDKDTRTAQRHLNTLSKSSKRHQIGNQRFHRQL